MSRRQTDPPSFPADRDTASTRNQKQSSGNQPLWTSSNTARDDALGSSRRQTQSSSSDSQPVHTAPTQPPAHLPAGAPAHLQRNGYYSTSMKVQVAKTAAYSYFYNRRNTENPLHILYGIMFTELTAKDHTLLPCVQYNLWLKDHDEKLPLPEALYAMGYGHKQEDVRCDDRSSEKSNEDEMNLGYEEEDEDFNEAANASFSSAHTESGTSGDRFPDLALLHLRLIHKPFSPRVENPKTAADFSRNHKHGVRWRHRRGIQIIHDCVPFLCELKAGPPRQLDLQMDESSKVEHETMLLRNLQYAHVDLAEYVVWCFAKYPYLEEIVAFAATGVYWQYVVLKKHHVKAEWYDWTNKKWKDPKFLKEYYARWPKNYYEVGTKESDAVLDEMYKTHLQPLCSFGTLDPQTVMLD
ncbi:hypothetical protein D9758_017632 [Tetrapyrgos nigripes]|uniref:Uncharacterized protein n=1 Tax=Tetrapyrgos nigripes TaxID=182062 RepID=A0A8H5CIL1_9AGAR|nr:hypothetical protein D9758_017632 [Tetrapyrgos nigripes]